MRQLLFTATSLLASLPSRKQNRPYSRDSRSHSGPEHITRGSVFLRQTPRAFPPRFGERLDFDLAVEGRDIACALRSFHLNDRRQGHCQLLLASLGCPDIPSPGGVLIGIDNLLYAAERRKFKTKPVQFRFHA